MTFEDTIRKYLIVNELNNYDHIHDLAKHFYEAGLATSKGKTEDKINLMMNMFNFKKVHDVMTAINWCWWDDSGLSTVPDVNKLKETALNLLKLVTDDSKLNSARLGCFQARYDHDGLLLHFETEDKVVSRLV